MHQPIKVVTLIAFLVLTASSASATLVTFTDRVTFEGGSPTLALEDFEEALVMAGLFEQVTGPLNSANSNLAFIPGDIQPGVEFADGPGPDAGDLTVLGAGVFAGTTKGILANVFTDGLNISFPTGAFAAGFDFLSAGGPGALFATTMNIFVFDTSNNLMGTFTPMSLNTGYVFWGVTTDAAPIGLIRLVSDAAGSEGVDNVAFAAAVPEPSTWMLLGAGLGLVGLGRRWSQRRAGRR